MSKRKRQKRQYMYSGLTPLGQRQLIEISRREVEKRESEIAVRSFLAQLTLPLNILVHDYWPKSAKKKAPKFIDDLLSLTDSWVRGVVTDKELEDLLFEFTGLRVIDLVDGGIVFRSFKVLQYRKVDDHEEGGCSKCGTLLANYGDTNFCPKCGTRLDWVA